MSDAQKPDWRNAWEVFLTRYWLNGEPLNPNHVQYSVAMVAFSVGWEEGRKCASEPRGPEELKVGDHVVCPHPDSFLTDAGVTPSTIGVITQLSRLGPDDRGVLVDWGSREVRCERRELALHVPGYVPPRQPKDPREYDGTPLCPRCGNGYPTCADIKGLPEWAHSALHMASCAIYRWDGDVCETCRPEVLGGDAS